MSIIEEATGEVGEFQRTALNDVFIFDGSSWTFNAFSNRLENDIGSPTDCYIILYGDVDGPGDTILTSTDLIDTNVSTAFDLSSLQSLGSPLNFALDFDVSIIDEAFNPSTLTTAQAAALTTSLVSTQSRTQTRLYNAGQQSGEGQLRDFQEYTIAESLSYGAIIKFYNFTIDQSARLTILTGNSGYLS